MRFPARVLPLLLCALWIAEPLLAQLPFYTDDPAVTERGKWHFEFFNEFDALQLLLELATLLEVLTNPKQKG